MCVSAGVSMYDCDYTSVSICMYEQMPKCACVCVGMCECEIGCAPLHSALGRLVG